MKNIVSVLVFVFSVFTVNISSAQIVEKQANKKQLLKGNNLSLKNKN